VSREEAIAIFRGAFPDLVRADELSIEDLREADDALWERFVPADAMVEEVDAEGVPALLVTAGAADDRGMVVWFHGGGYTIGSAAGRRGIAAEVSRRSGVPVLVPDYRLAPEHPFPAAVEDALASCSFASRRAGAGRIVLAGDSAGGGLALAALLALADGGLPQAAGAIALSPLADWTLSGATHRTHADRDAFVTVPILERLREGYLAGHSARDPLASPLFGDYAGLPPILVMVGEDETLLDDAIGVVDRATAAGVAAELRVFPGMFHLWPMFAPILPEGASALDELSAFVVDSLASGDRQ
jgi:monoterpene epsilon-lactone hydrolase